MTPGISLSTVGQFSTLSPSRVENLPETNKPKMRATHFLVQIVVISLFVSYIEGAAEMTCGEVIKEMGKKQMAGVGICTKELNFKNAKEKKERANCIVKCVLKKEHVVSI